MIAHLLDFAIPGKINSLSQKQQISRKPHGNVEQSTHRKAISVSIIIPLHHDEV
jgi:hypothetical protein